MARAHDIRLAGESGAVIPLDRRLERSTAPIVKAWDIGHVRFVRPDLALAERFMTDFGLSHATYSGDRLMLSAEAGYGPCYLVGQGPKPVFDGFGMAVSSLADLERLAALPDASPIEPAEGWPGGRQIRLRDPAGNEIRAVHGPARRPGAHRPPLAQNLAEHRDRLNAMQRPPEGPSHILRLGHVVITVIDFFKCARWYMDTFGLIPSDVQTIGDSDPALVFLRCDRGDTPADHHTVVLVQNVENGFSHCAFECIDVDDIAMGQEHLHSRGYRHAWGLGRHLLGSQLFDYWRDPWGDKVEHFVDSDMFTADRPTDVSPLSGGGIYQWGPPMPKDFEAPRLSPGFIWRAIQNVRRSEEMTFGRMKALLAVIQAPSRPWVKR